MYTIYKAPIAERNLKIAIIFFAEPSVYERFETGAY
jgi:hypothetical protein